MLQLLCFAVVCNLGAEIEDGKWAGQAGGSTCGDDCQVPPHNGRDKAEATSDLKEVCGPGQVRSVAPRIGDLPVCRSEEGEEEDEEEDSNGEWNVRSERAEEEDEADQHHDDVVEGLA